MLNKTRWAFATLVVNVGLLGCSDGGSDPVGGAGGGGPGGSTSGGAAPTSGGTTSGGATAGGATSGGATSGGAATSGGSGNGGSSSGGASSGGSSNGGSTSGGKSSTSGGSTSGGKSSGGASSGGKSSGGATGSGGSSSGGKSSGGASSGGKSSGGATGSGGATNTGAGPTTKCGCTTPAGEFSGNEISSTIVVDSGEVYDGKCMIFRAADSLGNGTQEEGQDPIFEVAGGTIQNVVMGNSAADGIHIEGNATLKNIHWLDIGEDAMSVGSGVSGNPTINLDCGSSAMGSDKTFQSNAESTWNIKNFTAKDAGKFLRQNGGTKFKMTLSLDHCDIADMGESIFRTDSTTSILNMTNTRYHNVGVIFYQGSNQVPIAETGNHAQVGNFSGNVAY